MGNFRRDLLPPPVTYYAKQGINLRGSSDWRNALCPFHKESNPSLRVNIVHGGFRCHACGAKGGDVLDFHMRRFSLGFIPAAKELGAWEEPLPPKVKNSAPSGQRHCETPKQAARHLAGPFLAKGFRPEALHVYRNEGGEPIYWVIRTRHPRTGDKEIRPMRRDGNRYVLGKPKFEHGTPLYGLDLLAFRKDETVLICEGEKCADALREHGIISTTSGGAMSATKADWQPLAGRDVLIWPDNDEPGLKYAEDVAEMLADIASSVRVIDSAALDLCQGGDAVDWFEVNPAAIASDILALPVKASTGASALAPGLTPYRVDTLLEAELKTIAQWISARCIRNCRAYGALGSLYRDFHEWNGPDFALSASLFAAALEHLGVKSEVGFACGLVLAADVQPGRGLFPHEL